LIRKNYSSDDALPESNYEKAKICSLETIIWSIAQQVEGNKRESLKKEWESETVDYDTRKYTFEYEIAMLNRVFGEEL